MKKFKIIGPDTETEIEIADDEMIDWTIRKIKDYMPTVGTKGNY